MRNLTITRHKSFVGSLCKEKVFIDDPISFETEINRIPCKKLGVIKNGETKTFEIDSNEHRIYVIADNLSRNYCNDFINIPAGTEDVFLSGKNKYNPANGNAFRFDGQASEEMVKNRKKGLIIGIIVLIVAFVFGLLMGFLPDFLSSIAPYSGEPKTFTAEEMEITLTDSFEEVETEGFLASYFTDDIGVLVLKESVEDLEGLGIETLDDYGELALQANGLDSSIQLQELEGITYFEYEAYDETSDEDFYYFVPIYKSADAYWILQFTSYIDDADYFADDFFLWAESVTFAE